MLSDKMRRMIKIALPVLFIVYASCITFFTHTHIVNGVTIVHSHPYATDDKGNPNHEHTGVEIQLIHTLSVFFVAGSIILKILLDIFRKKQATFIPEQIIPVYTRGIEPLNRLRPPPAL